MKQSMDFDDLGDRMKMYEHQEAARHFISKIPIIARLDGRAFHTFTKGLDRPYDKRFSDCMTATTIELVRQTNATIGYTQSDEITLVWNALDTIDDFWFAGRIQKMTSMLASIATLEFNLQVAKNLPEEYARKKPLFDCRVWQVPTREEAVNCLIWRENDAVKNSIMAMALHCVGQKKVFKKNQKEQLDLIHESGNNWNEQPSWAKRGTYISRMTTSKKFTSSELDSLPEKHAARTNPDLVIERSELMVLDLPRITSITNRCDVIFDKVMPVGV